MRNARLVGCVQALWRRHSTPFLNPLTTSIPNIRSRSNESLCARDAAASAASAPGAVSASAGVSAWTPAVSLSTTSTGSNPGHAPTQSVDFTTLTACVLELRRHWLPAKVEQAVQVEAHMLALRLRTMTGSAWLYLSWHPNTGHVGLSERGPERGALSEAFQFGEQVSSLTRGLVLSEVLQPYPWERVVQLQCSSRPGEPSSISIICETMGRYSNVVVADGDGKVLTAGHQVGNKMSSFRAVQVGRQYQPPPPPPGIDPDACNTFEEWQATITAGAQRAALQGERARGTVAEGIVRGFRALSPALAAQLCAAAGLAVSAVPAGLDAQSWRQLYDQWSAWLQRLRSGEFVCTSSDAHGSYSLVGSYASVEESVLEYMRTYYSRIQHDDDFDRAKARVQRGLATALQRLQRKVHSLRRQGASPDAHQATQRVADLLMANIHAIVPGSDVAVVEDWDAPGATVRIPLDSSKSAVANAEALYARARKQRRAVAQVAPLVAEAQSQVEYLSEVEVMLAQLAGREDAVALREVEADLVAGGHVKPPPGDQLAAKAASKARRANKRGAVQPGAGAGGYRSFTSPGGLSVLVGRNSRQNDELTMRKAQPSDVWMHARGVPGAHVLLRVPAGREAGAVDIQFAADIAAFYSKARTEGKADVTCASPADISKPRGAKLGQVLVKRERVVIGRPDSAAVQ